MEPVSRRRFVIGSTAGLAGILAARVPPARGQQREISYLCWNNFAPASDKKMAEIGQRFTKDTGIKLKIDHISHMGPQQAKYAAEVQTQAGHDLVEMRMHFPWLYEPQLVDVSDVVAELEKKYGKALSSAYEGAHVKGVWRAVPQYHGMFVATYREDLFKKASLKVPDTWEDLYVVGKELKKMGNPVGIPISQNYDTISTASPVLWSFGGMEVDKDGKTVRINSPATVQTIEWYQKMYQRLHGARGAVVVGLEQQRVHPAGQGGMDPQPGVRLYRGAEPQAGHRRRDQPPPQPRRPSWAPRDGRAALHRHLEVLEEHRRVQGVDPLPDRQARSLRRVHHVRGRVQPARLRPTCRTTRSSRPTRSTPPSRARACSTTPTAGRRRPRTRCSSSPTPISCPT